MEFGLLIMTNPVNVWESGNLSFEIKVDNNLARCVSQFNLSITPPLLQVQQYGVDVEAPEDVFVPCNYLCCYQDPE